MKQIITTGMTLAIALGLSNCAPQNYMQADAATGALGGAAVGGLIGAATGDRHDALRGAAIGGALGGAAGAVHGNNKDQGGQGLIPRRQPQQSYYRGY